MKSKNSSTNLIELIENDNEELQNSTNNKSITNLEDNKFLNDLLINKKNCVTGRKLWLNRLKILFFKNYYLRKNSKFVFLLELLIPILLFISKADYNSDDLNDLNEINFNYNSNQTKFSFPKIYYLYNSTNVKKIDLLEVFNEISLYDTIEFVHLTRKQKIKEIDYMIIKFNSFNYKSIDYEMKIVSIENEYYDWLNRDSRLLKFKRRDADIFHELLLKTHLSQLNSVIGEFRFDIQILPKIKNNDKFFLPDKRSKIEQLINKFINNLQLIYAMNIYFIFNTICDEKKNGQYNLLKLMGITNSHYLITQFFYHYFIWILSLIICLIYYFYYYIQISVPFNLIIILFIFSSLYLINLIIFIILLCALYSKLLYSQLSTILTTFATGSSFTKLSLKNSDVISYFKLVHPVIFIKRFKLIAKKLCNNFNYKENLFEIIIYSPADELSLLNLFLINILFVSIEILLCNYLEQINPLKEGVTLPFYYFLKKDYWIPPKQSISIDDLPDLPINEKQPLYKNPIMVIKDVNKTFRRWFYLFGSKRYVLKDFNFSVFDKEITVLFTIDKGKSTTTNIISGVMSADNGIITVKDSTVNKFMDDYKNKISYCPQKNTFYDQLSVYEHLKISAILKGVPFENVDKIILNLSIQFNLKEKLNKKVKKLNDGMKRCLFIAMSVIGYNDLLVIDEPTSGLEPENRKIVWECLMELKKHKAILLTTHSLEEAEFLGDRIAIMHDGNIRCSGSSNFLLHSYHVGQLLRIELIKEIDGNKLLDLIKNYLPDTIIENQHRNEYWYRLRSFEHDNNNSSINLLIADLFSDQFENSNIKNEFGIKSYSLINTSLEDVLFKIHNLKEEKKMDEGKKKNKDVEIKITNKDDHPFYSLNKLNGIKLNLFQFLAILLKKFSYSKENYSDQLFKSLGYPLVMPVLIILGALPYLIDFNLPKIINPIDSFQLERNKDIILIKNDFENDNFTNLFKIEQEWLKNEFDLNSVHSEFSTLNETIKDQIKNYGIKRFVDKVLFLVDRIDDRSYRFFNQKPFDIIGSIDIFYKTILKSIGLNNQLNINLKFIHESHIENHKFYFIQKVMDYYHLSLSFNLIIILFITISFSKPYSSFMNNLSDELNNGCFEIQKMSNLSKIIYWLGNFVYDFIYLLIIMVLSGCLIWLFESDYIIYSPYILNIIIVFILSSFNCLLITYLIMNLNFKKSRSNFITIFLLLIIGLIISMYDFLYNIVQKMELNSFYDQLYNKTSNELNYLDQFKSDLNIDQLKIESNINDEIKFNRIELHFLFKILSPIYNLNDCLLKYNDLFVRKLCYKKINLKLCDYLDYRNFNIQINIIAFILSSSIFILAIIIVNYLKKIEFLGKIFTNFHNSIKSFNIFKKIKKVIDNKKNIKEKENINLDMYILDNDENNNDENIDKEIELTKSIIVEQNDQHDNLLVVYDLSKEFGSNKIIDKLNFTVQNEQCLGFIGNCGHSTLLNLISGKIKQTNGKILIDNIEFKNNSHEYYEKIAYCTQSNSFINKITVRDNLLFFARINGIPFKMIKKVVDTLIEECELINDQHKLTNELSSGNKRKLQIAISLIGNKKLILLDEPTKNVDPISRCKLWKTILFYKKELNKSFILISHNIKDYERLCQKISFIIDGKCVCLGTYSYLKDRYSNGFKITIKIKDDLNNNDYINQLKIRIKNDFNCNEKLIDCFMNEMIYLIPFDDLFNWSKILRIMETIKIDFDLKNYLITDIDLELILNKFAMKSKLDLTKFYKKWSRFNLK